MDTSLFGKNRKLKYFFRAGNPAVLAGKAIVPRVKQSGSFTQWFQNGASNSPDILENGTFRI